MKHRAMNQERKTDFSRKITNEGLGIAQLFTHNGRRRQRQITNEIRGIARRIVEREGWIDARVETRRQMHGTHTALSKNYQLT